jgi:predicted CopG family antitoxin
MSRKPIQVTERVKAEVEFFKDKWNCKSESDVIDTLISYRKKSENHVELSNEVKQQLEVVKREIRASNDEETIKILLHHWANSERIEKSTMRLILEGKYSRW